jgi:hypothetical protein
VRRNIWRSYESRTKHLGKYGKRECDKNMKKICFAILVHENSEVIQDQIENIRYFCPNSSIVFFQSGNDDNLCKGLGYPICPTSHPMKYGRTYGWFFLNIMEWLENTGYEYDYLINLDSDSLFAKKGFEDFIISEMNEFEYMAAHYRMATEHWFPGNTMKKVWHLWQPIFNMDHFYGCFGSQVFSQKFVKQILSFNKLEEMKRIMKQTEDDVLALEEMLFATLAKTLGVKSKPYPANVGKWMRDRPKYRRRELINAVKNNEECYLLHPVNRFMNDPARTFIRSMVPSRKRE